MKDKKWYEFRDYKEMTPQEKEEYKKHKAEIITNYLGVSTSPSSMRLRTQAYLEETKTGFWD
jgi:hypothetical protein